MICRSCGNTLKAPFLNLGNSPLSNSFLTEEGTHRMEAYYPLEVFRCEKCHLVQIDEFESAENIFSVTYPYFSSFSETWLAHSKAYVEMMTSRFDLGKASFVVEVASNDGYLLQYFKGKGVPHLGIEPAVATAQAARAKGVNTETCFFTTALAEKMKGEGKQADLILGNNVLAHNPNLNDFIKGMKVLLKPDGVITMEFPHLMRLIAGNQFDTVYHEHFSYLSLHAVKTAFERHGLKIFDVDELPTHGGSLRVYAGNDVHAKTPRVEVLLKAEKDAGLLDGGVYEEFALRVEAVKRNLLKLLVDLVSRGKRVAGYGAPAKGNTLLNYCGIRTDFVAFTVDRNPAKQGKFLPGTHIPIGAPERIFRDKPDYVLILPWNIKDEIMAQMASVRAWGAKFIVPIPEVSII